MQGGGLRSGVEDVVVGVRDGAAIDPDGEDEVDGAGDAGGRDVGGDAAPFEPNATNWPIRQTASARS